MITIACHGKAAFRLIIRRGLTAVHLSVMPVVTTLLLHTMGIACCLNL